MKLLTMQFSLASYCFLPLRSTEIYRQADWRGNYTRWSGIL